MRRPIIDIGRNGLVAEVTQETKGERVPVGFLLVEEPVLHTCDDGLLDPCHGRGYELTREVGVVGETLFFPSC